jgi:hypothetical protein
MTDNATAAPAELDERAVEAGITALSETMSQDNPLTAEALAVAAATAAGRYVPGRDSVADALAACVIIRDLTEVVEKMVINDDGKPGPGTVAEYADGLFDGDGTRVATMTGQAVVMTMTPHMWQYHKAVVEFEDGTIENSGVLDATAVVHGITQTLEVVGVSGRYEGMSGFRTIVVSDPEKTPPLYRATFVLC